MKTILVPTDFSAFSDHALHLAMVLAKPMEARILLCHVVQIPLVMGEVPFSILENEKNELKKDAGIKLMAQTLKIDHAGGLPYQTIILDGEIADELVNCIKKENVSLVLMGTKGSKNLQDVILGSVTEQLIQKSKCPVMAVPENIHFNKTIKHITFATDYHKGDVIDILKLIDIAKTLKAQVNVLHVSGDEISADQEVKLMSDFMHKISANSDYNNLSFQILHGNNVIQKLQEYLREESTDILVTAAHHRNLLERIFSKSHTLELLKDSKIPVIAFHFNAVS